jgi:hypothetical protein
MRNDGGLFPLVVAILCAGLVLSVMDETHAHWIAILLAFATVGGIAGSRGR